MSGWQEERRRRDRARRDEVMSLPVLRVRRHGAIEGQDGDVLACASVGPPEDLAQARRRSMGYKAPHTESGYESARLHLAHGGS